MDTITNYTEEQKKNYRVTVYLIRYEMRIRVQIQIYYRYLRKTVHNPYTEEQQEQFRIEIKNLYEELWKVIEKPKWMYGESNHWDLRHLNIAYRILRGKEPIYPTKKQYSQPKINDIVKRYSKDWYGKDKDEWKKLDKTIHENIMKRLNS
jgi:hypothetical protein